MKPFIWAFVFLSVTTHTWSRAGFDDDRVMLQGFYWDSYQATCEQQ